MKVSAGKKIVVIVGPNASGKSELAVKLARRFNGEIISADSRQVYRGMNIGSGKIAKKEMLGIPHHLLDVASPKRTFTAAQYQKLGRLAIESILSRGKLPIVVGGTGFYIDSLIYDYNLPNVPPNKALRNELEKKSAAELFSKLQKLDPPRARNIDKNNKRRIIRAIEIIRATKKHVPPKRVSLRNDSPYEVLKIGVKPADAILKNNIKKRLRKRMRRGMVAEVLRLKKGGLSWQKLDNFGLEYRLVSRYLRGLIAKDEMLKKLAKEIWRYGKRQMTWFRKDKSIHWANSKNEAVKLVKNFLSR